jgi:arylsulfatase A-like enzyme
MDVQQIFARLPILALLVAALACLSARAAGGDDPQSTSPEHGLPPAAATAPNVLLIVADDMGWTDFRFMGHPHVRTPHLDRLAAEGLLFTRGYVPSSLCCPSLASIITGLYGHQSGITSNDPPPGVDRREMLPPMRRAATLPRLLGELGYRSLQTGKWWHGGYAEGGFTDGLTHGDVARGGRHGDEGLRIGRQGIEPIREFVRSCGGRPFFVWYAPMMPHQPHDPPARLLERYLAPDRSEHVARYWAMCEWFDETCGALLDFLDAEGLAQSTLVAFVSDNGWIQDPDRPGYAPRSKRSPYDGGLRTPIILRWPGRIEPRRDETTLASSIDLAPTILAACGAMTAGDCPDFAEPAEQNGTVPLSGGGVESASREMQGVNLLDESRPPREAIFGEIFTHDAADLDHPAASLLFRWCLAGPWKLIVPRDASLPVELYDVLTDPEESHDVAAEHPDVAADLRKRIDAWWAAQ